MNNVLIKFLSEDPLQNIIVPLNYQFDKIIYYAFQSTFKKFNNFKDHNLKFANKLKTVCRVDGGVKYYSLDNRKIKEIKDSFINLDYKNNNYYVDLTGCEGIVGVAFIEACKLYDIPAFTYDIKLDREFYIFKSSKVTLDNLPKRKIDISIEDYINFSGGIIRKNEAKDFKTKNDSEDFNKLVNIKNHHQDKWVYFAGVMKNIQNNKSLIVKNINILSMLSGNKMHISFGSFQTILEELNAAGLVKILKFGNTLSFSFKNSSIKNLLIDAGSIFEVQTYLNFKKKYKKCLIGVSLDWDGIILPDTSEDVYNEVDVIYLDGYTLTFVSCKDSLSFDKKSLYELEAVASRFGGKYCKMIFACTCKLKMTVINRAKSMGIEILNY